MNRDVDHRDRRDLRGWAIMSANKVDAGAPWVVTCDLTEDHSEEFYSKLSVEQLGEALKEKGWVMPIYGGTFCPRHYAAMQALKAR